MSQTSLQVRDANNAVQNILTGKDADGNQACVTLGKPFELGVTQGQIEGYSTLDKFGENPDVDTGTIPEDIWEGGGLYNWSTTADIDTLSSSDAGDTGQLVGISGILDPTIATGETVGYAYTNGQNKVNIYATAAEAIAGSGTTLSFWRVYRMQNLADAGGELAGMLYCYVDSAITGGVPDDATQVRALIDDENNQTLMALYTVPPKKVGFLYRGEIAASRSLTTGEAQCAYYSRRYGKVFQVKKRVNISNSGSSLYQDCRSFPDIIPALTDIRLTVENVSANNMGVTGTFDILLVDEDKFSSTYLAAIGQPGY